MVKGINRRMVMVRFGETGLFENAFFIVREDTAAREGVSADEVLHEACQIAAYHNTPLRREMKRRLHPFIYAAIGAAGVGALWALSFFIL